MDIERDEWIRQRAYGLWEEQGYPDGQDGEHWAQANAEWEEASAHQLQSSAVTLTPAGETWAGSASQKDAE